MSRTEDFIALSPNLKLPLRLTNLTNGYEAGVIHDAAGEICIVVDPDNNLPDAEAEAIARMIVLAVNTCAGFRADHSPNGVEPSWRPA